MITRRTFLGTGAGAVAALLRGHPLLAAARPDQAPPPTVSTAASSDQAPPPAVGAAASRAYRRAIVVDALTGDTPDLDADAPIAAGMTAAVVDLAIFPRTYLRAVQELERWKTAFQQPGSKLLEVLRAADLESAKRQGKLGVVLACQGAAILDSSTASVNDFNLRNLRQFYGLGLRVLQLTHNERNAVGDSFREKTDAGLSRLGEQVVAEMNTLGMLIDLSHCGDQTTLQAIRLSSKPCAVTHAGCRALQPTLRNKSDAVIREVAARGGFFGIYNMSLWLTERDTTSIADVLDHIDHAVRIAGIDHVGFGSDGPVGADDTPPAEALAGMQSYARRNLGLPGSERIPSHVLVEALNSPRRLLVLADGLARRGYLEDAIEKIIGGNFVRVFRETCG